MRQKSEQTRQNVLNKLYNQDIAPQDSEITSFYYHKTLALECLIAVFSLCSIVLTLVSYVYKQDVGQEIIERSYNLLFVFTILGILAIILKKVSEVKWIKQKKQKNINIKSQVFILLLQVMLYLPTPMKLTDTNFVVTDYSSNQIFMNYNAFISFYLLFNRFIYIIIFLIHSELYYGSRPDRLSRLYTVKFGTFNAVKFLINEKPGSVIKVTFSFNFVILPFAMFLIEGYLCHNSRQINKMFSSFHSCLYFVVVTQATVGYGDITPSTIFGRIVTLVIIIAGVTNTALLLILFMRLMELRSEEEESLFLLQSLEKKVSLTRARVFRIESQWIYSNMRIPPQERSSKEQEIKAIRYNNRRNIMLDRGGPINVKRIFQNLNSIHEKNNIISKCIDVIKSSDENGEKMPDKQNGIFTNSQNAMISSSMMKNKLRESMNNLSSMNYRKNSSIKKENILVKMPSSETKNEFTLTQSRKEGNRNILGPDRTKLSSFMYDNDY